MLRAMPKNAYVNARFPRDSASVRAHPRSEEADSTRAIFRRPAVASPSFMRVRYEASSKEAFTSNIFSISNKKIDPPVTGFPDRNSCWRRHKSSNQSGRRALQSGRWRGSGTTRATRWKPSSRRHRPLIRLTRQRQRQLLPRSFSRSSRTAFAMCRNYTGTISASTAVILSPAQISGLMSSSATRSR